MRDVLVISDQTGIPSVAKEVSDSFDWVDDARLRAEELALQGISSKIYVVLEEVKPGAPEVIQKDSKDVVKPKPLDQLPAEIVS